MLVLAGEFLTLYSVEVMNATCEDLAEPSLADACLRTGGEQHGYGLVALAALIATMAWGAARGGSRPAAYALLAAGLAVLVIVIVLDLPDTRSTGAVGARFEEARASAGPAIWVQIAGGGLAVVAAALALRRGPASRPR